MYNEDGGNGGTDPLDVLQGGMSVKGIEGIAGIDQEDTLDILLLEGLPHCVDGCLSTRWLASTELHCAIRFHDITAYEGQDCLGNDSSSCFVNSDWSYAWIFC